MPLAGGTRGREMPLARGVGEALGGVAGQVGHRVLPWVPGGRGLRRRVERGEEGPGVAVGADRFGMGAGGLVIWVTSGWWSLGQPASRACD